MARIVVAGYAVRHPVGGNLIACLHHVLGLMRLGHDVVYLEESGWPQSCYDPGKDTYSDDPGPGLRTLHALMAHYQVQVPVYYVNRDSGQTVGADWETVQHRLRSADLLLNVGGVCWLPEFRLCRRRALVDKDPFFTQVGRIGVTTLDEYDVHFTYGTNIGRPGCTIPSMGIEWHPTVPPVVPDLWKGGDPRTDAPLTTIAKLRAYDSVTYQGEHYGQKEEELLRFLDLPRRTPQRLELAVACDGKTMARLQSAGWSVRDAGEVSMDVHTYQAYIMGSRGEFSVAKHGYVKARSGWFSDRSVCYLAAGLPVILQETGFTDWLPTGRGVLAFTSIEDATDCIERVNAEYPAHRAAAAEMAAQTFSYQVVLRKLVETAIGC